MNTPNSMEKQIILGKLTNLMEQASELPTRSRHWIAEARALIDQYDPSHVRITIAAKLHFLNSDPEGTINSIEGYVTDTIEKIKLELELEGRTEIGTAYRAGEVYRYFADLKQVIEKTTRDILVVDPYLDGKTFDAYFRDCPINLMIRILTRHYVDDIKPYIAKHEEQYGTRITMKESGELHDRLILIDRADCWISGGSIKDAATSKPAFLIPLMPPILEDKIRIYNEIWDRAISS